ncbi:phage tail fiber protein [Morganella morganii]|uniref:phage tail fiber protein n=1 Tax=Morganella morganii TaxID=582 RepID=UPI00388E8BB3
MIYTDGTIAINAGSPIVTGSGTQWKKNIHGVAPGQLISIENGTALVSMMIRAVNSDTELVLSFNAPVTLSGAKYSIATTVPDSISDAARTMSANQGYIVYFLRAMQQWMTDTGQVEIELPNGQKVTLEDLKGLASREWVNTVLFGVGDKAAKASGIMNPDNTMWWGAHNDYLYAKASGNEYNSLFLTKGGELTVKSFLNCTHRLSIADMDTPNTFAHFYCNKGRIFLSANLNGKWPGELQFPLEGGMIASQKWVGQYVTRSEGGGSQLVAQGGPSVIAVNPDGNTGMWDTGTSRWMMNIHPNNGATISSGLVVKSKKPGDTSSKVEVPSPSGMYSCGLWSYNDGRVLLSSYSSGWSNINIAKTGSGTMAVIGGNTAFDGSGYLKRSSPIIQINPDGHYDTNDESEGAEVSHTGTGQYHITGILGYNSDGAWGVNGGISVPKDNNGLELVYVDDRVQSDGSLIIETCHRQHAHLPERFQNWRLKEITPEGERIFYQDGEPCDLPESTRLDVRVEMPQGSVWNVKQRELAEQMEREQAELEAQEAAEQAGDTKE